MLLPACPVIPGFYYRRGRKSVEKSDNEGCCLERYSSVISGRSGEIVKLPLNERIKTGRRLLSVSRENLRRIFILSYAYRMTGKNEFLKRGGERDVESGLFFLTGILPISWMWGK